MKKFTVILFTFLLTFTSVQEAGAQRLTVKTTTVDVGGTGYGQTCGVGGVGQRHGGTVDEVNHLVFGLADARP